MTENQSSNGLKQVEDKDEDDEEEIAAKNEKTPTKKKKMTVNGDNENDDNDDNEEGDDQIDDEEDENVAKLYDEATMPLEEVLKRYKNTENKVKKALNKKGILKQNLGRPSPMITAAGSSSSASKLRKKQLEEEDDVERRPLDFQKQEEEDISEIKKNGGQGNESIEDINSSVQNHEQDYDEASNLVRFFCWIKLNFASNQISTCLFISYISNNT